MKAHAYIIASRSFLGGVWFMASIIAVVKAEYFLAAIGGTMFLLVGLGVKLLIDNLVTREQQ